MLESYVLFSPMCKQGHLISLTIMFKTKSCQDMILYIYYKEQIKYIYISGNNLKYQ